MGKWERRTERRAASAARTRAARTSTNPRLAEEYDPKDEGEQTLGRYHRAEAVPHGGSPGSTWRSRRSASGSTRTSHNILKRQEYALSGRLLRTAYYPKWKKIYSPSKKGDTWYPEEMRFYDEVEKANSTLILIKAVDPNALPANLFTKAWLESKSR